MPVILVSARAGEEARVEGLAEGADDYLVKPFAARELVARVDAHLRLARERWAAATALREREAWLRGQRAALEAALNGAPLATSLDALVRTATKALGEGTRAAFYLANGDGTTLHHVVGMPDDYARAVDGFVIGPGSLACGLAASTGEPVVTVDVTKEPRWEPWRWMAAQFDYRGCWSFPIHSADGTYVGSFAVYSRQPRDATLRDRELAALLTQTAAIIVSRDAEAQARKRAEETLRTREKAAVLELEHTQQLQKMSSLILEGATGEALHERILDAAMAIAHADFGSMQRLNDDGQLELLASRNFDPDDAEAWQIVSGETGAVCSAALDRGTRVTLADLRTPPADLELGAETLRQLQQRGINAFESIPLVSSEGHVVGVISTLWRDPHASDQRQRALIDILARQAADFFERRLTPRPTRRQARSSTPTRHSSRWRLHARTGE